MNISSVFDKKENKDKNRTAPYSHRKLSQPVSRHHLEVERKTVSGCPHNQKALTSKKNSLETNSSGIFGSRLETILSLSSTAYGSCYTNGQMTVKWSGLEWESSSNQGVQNLKNKTGLSAILFTFYLSSVFLFTFSISCLIVSLFRLFSFFLLYLDISLHCYFSWPDSDCR